MLAATLDIYAVWQLNIGYYTVKNEEIKRRLHIPPDIWNLIGILWPIPSSILLEASKNDGQNSANWALTESDVYDFRKWV